MPASVQPGLDVGAIAAIRIGVEVLFVMILVVGWWVQQRLILALVLASLPLSNVISVAVPFIS